MSRARKLKRSSVSRETFNSRLRSATAPVLTVGHRTPPRPDRTADQFQVPNQRHRVSGGHSSHRTDGGQAASGPPLTFRAATGRARSCRSIGQCCRRARSGLRGERGPLPPSGHSFTGSLRRRVSPAHRTSHQQTARTSIGEGVGTRVRAAASAPVDAAHTDPRQHEHHRHVPSIRAGHCTRLAHAKIEPRMPLRAGGHRFTPSFETAAADIRAADQIQSSLTGVHDASYEHFERGATHRAHPPPHRTEIRDRPTAAASAAPQVACSSRGASPRSHRPPIGSDAAGETALRCATQLPPCAEQPVTAAHTIRALTDRGGSFRVSVCYARDVSRETPRDA